MKSIILLASAAMLTPGVAVAAPGLDSKVYGARVESGVTEVEARYARLTGKSEDGVSALVVEFAHGFSSRFYGGVLATVERQPGQSSRVAGVGFEGIYALGTVPGIGADVALYGEYAAAFRGEPDTVEAKLLLEKTFGGIDARLNLVAERLTEKGAPLAFSYLASVDYPVIGDDIRLGMQAFGDLGDTDRFGGRQENFVGPVAKIEIEHLPIGELEIETGYLFATGASRDGARGQARLLLEWEFRF